jgi:hypothetical protein
MYMLRFDIVIICVKIVMQKPTQILPHPRGGQGLQIK